MDTPERSNVGGTPISKVEDSPIFNFINSLSPIHPAKSVHGVQTFQSLSYASMSSVFSSPHVNTQKGSRFLISQPFRDSSKFEVSSNNVDKSNLCPIISNAAKLSTGSTVAQGKNNITCLLNEATVDPPDESLTQANNFTQIQYQCGSPDHNTSPSYGIKVDLKFNTGHTSVEVAQFVPDGAERRKRKILFSTEIEVQEKNNIEESEGEPSGFSEGEPSGSEWEKLISDDLLFSDSPTESDTCKGQDEKMDDEDANTLTAYTSGPVDVIDIPWNTQPEVSYGTCLLNATDDPTLNNNEEVGQQHGVDHTPQILSGTCQKQAVLSDQTQETGHGDIICLPFCCKVDSQQQRDMRRRCLVFEVSEVPGKKANNDSTPHPSVSLSSSGKFTSDDRHLMSMSPGSSLTQHVLPSIGLHLNTLATTSKDKMVTSETLLFGRRVISMPCTISPFPPLTASKSLEVEKDKQPAGIVVRDPGGVHNDSCETPTVGGSEDLNHSSPRKKKRKSGSGGENEACKRCNCKKSKCLKLYCECFAAGVYCVEPCSCQGCFNKPIHEETVLVSRKQIESRNPLAFAPKVIRASEPVQEAQEENNKTPASARHKRGCTCKKSSCLKKYCECYQAGVGCSPSCRCEGCKNAFGRKNEADEIEHGEEERDDCEKHMEKAEGNQQNAVAQNNEQPLAENILPITPHFQICSSSVKLPFNSRRKPPRSSTRSIGNQTSQMLRICDTHLRPCTTEKNLKAASEEDTPQILREDASPSTGFKTSSPNGKRVSPPHIRLGTSTDGRGRKLILQSIPSFPSLNCAVSNDHTVNYSSSSLGSSTMS